MPASGARRVLPLSIRKVSLTSKLGGGWLRHRRPAQHRMPTLRACWNRRLPGQDYWLHAARPVLDRQVQRHSRPFHSCCCCADPGEASRFRHQHKDRLLENAASALRSPAASWESCSPPPLATCAGRPATPGVDFAICSVTASSSSRRSVTKQLGQRQISSRPQPGALGTKVPLADYCHGESPYSYWRRNTERCCTATAA